MTEKMPLVTVYITNFNYGKYIKNAIDSVLRQTFTELELLIVDDGSTDDSRQIIEGYTDLKGVFVVYQKNKGLNISNNIALEMARGRYLIRLDADDWLEKQAIELMFLELERNSEVNLVFPDYCMVDAKGQLQAHIRRSDHGSEVSLYDRPAHGACTMIRVDFLKRVGGYDPSFRRQDGYDIWLKAIASGPVANINLPLFFYRQHGNNLTGDQRSLLETRAAIKKKNAQLRGRSLCVAVIPTRGRDLDPRSEPLRDLGGKPLINWTIDAAIRAETVVRIIVSSPDDKILNHVVSQYGDQVLIHRRLVDLAAINLDINGTIRACLSDKSAELGAYDCCAILYLEYTFRPSMFVDKAVDTLTLFDVDQVQSIRRDNDIFLFHDGAGLRRWQENELLRLEREELYRGAGGIHVFARRVLEGKDLFSPSQKIGHIEIDERSAFRLHSEFTWQMANSYMDKEIED